MDDLFLKIINREIPADILFEDEQCIAINDIAPQAPVHILVIPKQPIAKLADMRAEHQGLLGHLMLVAAKMAAAQNVSDNFRLVINNGKEACQSIFHFHLHVLGGRKMSWPPG